MPIPEVAVRGLAAVALAVVLTAVPISRVAACSCAAFSTEEAIANAQLAFIGTVADQKEVGVRNDFGDEMRQYAFAVERATAATDAVAIVRAGTSGASCGITFANGERWLIIATRGQTGLETSLCSGNLRLADLEVAEAERISALLPPVSGEPPASGEEFADEPGVPMGPIAIGAAALLLAAAAFVAFRHAR